MRAKWQIIDRRRSQIEIYIIHAYVTRIKHDRETQCFLKCTKIIIWDTLLVDIRVGDKGEIMSHDANVIPARKIYRLSSIYTNIFINSVHG